MTIRCLVREVLLGNTIIFYRTATLRGDPVWSFFTVNAQANLIQVCRPYMSVGFILQKQPACWLLV